MDSENFIDLPKIKPYTSIVLNQSIDGYITRYNFNSILGITNVFCVESFTSDFLDNNTSYIVCDLKIDNSILTTIKNNNIDLCCIYTSGFTIPDIPIYSIKECITMIPLLYMEKGEAFNAKLNEKNFYIYGYKNNKVYLNWMLSSIEYWLFVIDDLKPFMSSERDIDTIKYDYISRILSMDVEDTINGIYDISSEILKDILGRYVPNNTNYKEDLNHKIMAIKTRSIFNNINGVIPRILLIDYKYMEDFKYIARYISYNYIGVSILIAIDTVRGRYKGISYDCDLDIYDIVEKHISKPNIVQGNYVEGVYNIIDYEYNTIPLLYKKIKEG